MKSKPVDAAQARIQLARQRVRATAAMAFCCLLLEFAAAATLPPHRSGVVVDGNARFTVITPTLIRMEYSSDGHFIDERTYFAWERRQTPPQFTAQRTAGTLTLTTSRLKLTWSGASQPFSPANLSVAFRNDNGDWQTWRPDDPRKGNLGGTLENLDGAAGSEPLPDGVVSRDGWYLYQDKSLLLTNGPHPWIQPRPNDEIDDWYFFGYGANGYHDALSDLTTISGRIPIPPRFMLGSWRSRFWSYTQDQFRQLVLDYDAHRFPLDVLVMDMGWHTTPHWGSLDWNHQLIPDPTALLAWLHARQLHVTLNWHPNEGVGPWYSQYAEFCRALGIDPAKQAVIPFEDTNQKFMETYYRLLMDPLEKQGVDFWWLDGGVHLAWDNALDFQDIERPGTGRRGASFSRWGGWGDQRYPIWFSGDTSALWPVLRFEVPFTATAGNVGADYWSNDISGFRVKIPDGELFTRWVQFGALSPVFRTHGEDEFGNYRIPWDYGKQAEAASRRAYNLRDELFPYIYSSAYLTWKTSLPLARPLYLDFPAEEQAYLHPEEYEFGPDLLVAPIVTRGMGKAWLGATDMWFPSGTWWNLLTGERVNQPGNRTVLATAAEIPVFVRGGVPLPMQHVTPRMADRPPDPLVVRVYPGPDGRFTMYEDDGRSPAYLHGASALTPLEYTNRGDGAITLSVGPTRGSYTGQPTTRSVVVELPVTAHPASVRFDESELRESPSAVPGYTYDPVAAATQIRLPAESLRSKVALSVKFLGSPEVQALLPEIVHQIATVDRALAGAGSEPAEWRFELESESFDLHTLLSRAEQVLGPATRQDLAPALQAMREEQSAAVTHLQVYKDEQARAAALAMANAYLDASVKLRKSGEGLMTRDVPRDRARFGAPNNLDGYNAGLMVRVLAPPASGAGSLSVHVSGLDDKRFNLPETQTASFAFLPFLKATQHPLYHLEGTVTLTLSTGASQRVLTRDVLARRDLLDQWNLLGPFPKDKAPAIGGEPVTPATLRRTYPGQDGKPLSWETWQHATRNQMYERANDYLETMKPWIDLYTIYPVDDAAAVAVTWVNAPRAIRAQLTARHKAGISVWLNQQAVLQAAGAGGVMDLTDPPPDATEVNLQQGWNEIVVRTEDEKQDWGFSLQLMLPPGVICAQSDQPPDNNSEQK